jgi:Zn-dependent protease
MAHVDWIGTVILPLISLAVGGVFLGWGRAVNTNPARLKGGYNGLVAVALAGPGSNVVFAAVLGLLSAFAPQASDILFRAAYLSLYLAIFNMLPIPPLDGSKFLLAARIPDHWYMEVSRFGFIALLLVMSYTGLGRWMSNVSFTGAHALFSVGQ